MNHLNNFMWNGQCLWTDGRGHWAPWPANYPAVVQARVLSMPFFVSALMQMDSAVSIG